MRIAVDFSNVDLAAGSPQLEYLQKKLVPAAVEWWQRTLAVRRVQGPLKLSAWCESEYRVDFSQFGTDSCASYAATTTCAGHEEVTIPSDHITSGVENADFLLYVSNKAMDATTLGYALSCQRDQFGRPIAGMINLTPTHVTASTDVTSPSFIAQWEKEFMVSLHELGHALGFSSSSFAHFVDAGGNPLAADDVVRRVTERGESVQKLITPLISARAQDHFACHAPTTVGGINGVELESQGSEGTAGSHLESRIYMDELMTGAIQENTVKSTISLSFFEDSGWYHVNYTQAEPQPWGFHSGCAFPSKPCVDAATTTPLARSFCVASGATRCTASREQTSTCRVGTWPTDLPTWYQYFGSGLPKQGGMAELNDYCPVHGNDAAAIDEVCTDDTSGTLVSGTSASAALSAYGATHGAQSRCFDSSLNTGRSSAADSDTDRYAFVVRAPSSRAPHPQYASSTIPSTPPPPLSLFPYKLRGALLPVQVQRDDRKPNALHFARQWRELGGMPRRGVRRHADSARHRRRSDDCGKCERLLQRFLRQRLCEMPRGVDILQRGALYTVLCRWLAHVCSRMPHSREPRAGLSSRLRGCGVELRGVRWRCPRNVRRRGDGMHLRVRLWGTGVRENALREHMQWPRRVR